MVNADGFTTRKSLLGRSGSLLTVWAALFSASLDMNQDCSFMKQHQTNVPAMAKIHNYWLILFPPAAQLEKYFD